MENNCASWKQGELIKSGLILSFLTFGETKGDYVFPEKNCS